MPLRTGTVVALGRAALIAAVATTLAAGASAQNVRIVQRETVRNDSIMERILVADPAEVRRMVERWREREGQLLKELRSGVVSDASTRRRLDEELSALTRDGFSMISAIESRCRDESLPRPSGYLGVVIDQQLSLTGGGVRNGENRLTSVEPGSPAQAAGLRPGDRLLAIGGRDARVDLPDLDDLLVPGKSVSVRVERSGATRDFALTVARRPEGFGESCGEFQQLLQPLRAAGSGRLFIESRGGADPRALQGERAGVNARPLGEPEAFRFYVFGSGTGGETSGGYFAGAEFRALDDGWRDVLGVQQGVIVNDVASGSAAALAGLRSGDVITAVDRKPVTSPVTLVQLLGMSDLREVTLAVVRGKEKKTLVLRLGSR